MSRAVGGFVGFWIGLTCAFLLGQSLWPQAPEMAVWGICIGSCWISAGFGALAFR